MFNPSISRSRYLQGRWAQDGRSAFSLVETTIALGLVSFCMLALVGVLPVGLTSVHESAAEIGQVSILNYMRAQLQQTSLTNIANLKDQSYPFDRQGQLVTNAADGYFSAKISSVAAPVMPGMIGNQDALLNKSAACVQIDVTYPLAAPVASRLTNSLVLLVAEQKNQP